MIHTRLCYVFYINFKKNITKVYGIIVQIIDRSNEYRSDQFLDFYQDVLSLCYLIDTCRDFKNILK